MKNKIQRVADAVNKQLKARWTGVGMEKCSQKFVDTFEINHEDGTVAKISWIKYEGGISQTAYEPPQNIVLDVLLMIEKLGQFKKNCLQEKRKVFKRLCETNGAASVIDAIKVFLEKSYVHASNFLRYEKYRSNDPVPDNGVAVDYFVNVPREVVGPTVDEHIRGSFLALLGDVRVYVSDETTERAKGSNYYIPTSDFSELAYCFGLNIPSEDEVNKNLEPYTDKLRDMKSEYEAKGVDSYEIRIYLKDEKGKKIGTFHKNIRDCITDKTPEAIMKLLGDANIDIVRNMVCIIQKTS